MPERKVELVKNLGLVDEIFTQKRSEFWLRDAVAMDPFARTKFIDCIVSNVRPHMRDVKPKPP